MTTNRAKNFKPSTRRKTAEKKGVDPSSTQPTPIDEPTPPAEPAPPTIPGYRK